MNRRTSMGPGADDGPRKKSSKSRGRVSMAPRVAGGETSLAADNNGGAATPSRRKSYGGDRRKSLAPPSVADLRPISDKAYINSCIRRLVQYLMSSGYEYPVSHKILTRPSGKDFNHIVTFLLRRVDPTFNDGTLKFEDEVAMAFKALGYPFPISKTALVAAGSPHTWPALLAALIWIMELLQCDEADTEDDDIGANGDDEPPKSTEELAAKSDAAFFRFLGASYESFLMGDDEQVEALKVNLIELFEKDNAHIEKEIDRFTDTNASIVETIDNLGRKAEDLPDLEKRREDYATDLEKFHELVKQLGEHKATLSKKVKERTKELEKNEKELERVMNRVEALKEKVQKQELSVDDARRMQSEKARVKESIERAVESKQKQNKLLWEAEMELNRRIEQLETLAAQYNALASELLLIPETAENANGKKFMVEVHKEHAHEQNQSLLLGGVDLCSVAIPSISKLKSDYEDKSAHAREDLLELLDQVEASEEAITEAANDIKILEGKKKKSEEVFTREKEEQERALSVLLREIEVIETKIASIYDPVSQEEAITRYQRRCAELEALLSKTQEEGEARKQAVRKEINDALVVCAEHKEYQRKKLAELEAYIQMQSDSFTRVSLPLGENADDFCADATTI